MKLGADAVLALDRLDDALRRAPAVGRELFCKVTDHGVAGVRALRHSGKTPLIDRLIEAGAWTEAALALTALEMPAWKLRRLLYENGEWLCTLSRQCNLPIELDDTVEASHATLPLAVLRALVEAWRRRSAAPSIGSAVPEVRQPSGRMICCDNFA